MTQHKDIELEQIHIGYNWTYADAAARTGATGMVSADVGKFARQLDDNSIWMLTATTPTWIAVGGGIALLSTIAKKDNQTLTNNNDNLVNFDTELYDTLDLLTVPTTVLTISEDGLYTISVNLYVQPNWSAGTPTGGATWAYILINNLYTIPGMIQGHVFDGTAGDVYFSQTITISLSALDTIKIDLYVGVDWGAATPTSIILTQSLLSITKMA